MKLVVDFLGIISRPVGEVYYETGTQRGIQEISDEMRPSWHS